MNILKLALFGSLKLAIFAYTLVLSVTSVTGRATESNADGDDTASYGVIQSSSNGIAKFG